MTYLRELMKDYKNEVKEILAADKQLATEIQFDLKKWEEEMEARKAREEEEVWYVVFSLNYLITVYRLDSKTSANLLLGCIWFTVYTNKIVTRIEGLIFNSIQPNLSHYSSQLMFWLNQILPTNILDT